MGGLNVSGFFSLADNVRKKIATKPSFPTVKPLCLLKRGHDLLAGELLGLPGSVGLTGKGKKPSEYMGDSTMLQ